MEPMIRQLVLKRFRSIPAERIRKLVAAFGMLLAASDDGAPRALRRGGRLGLVVLWRQP
ncbi:MAG: hypothetical protein AB1634_14000 [Thermodesulfobacteriota bacterium]